MALALRRSRPHLESIVHAAGSTVSPHTTSMRRPPAPANAPAAHRGRHQRGIHPGHRHLGQLVKVGGEQGVAGPSLRRGRAAASGRIRPGCCRQTWRACQSLTNRQPAAHAPAAGPGLSKVRPHLLQGVQQLQAASGQPPHILRRLAHQPAPHARSRRRQPCPAPAAVAAALCSLHRLRVQRARQG